ncbi:MAG: VanZ family protein [Pseudooceanicola nanhaiensis]
MKPGQLWRGLVALLPVLVFVSSTQLPAPMPGTLVCPVPFTDAEFIPFNSVAHLKMQVEAWGWQVAFFEDRTFLSLVLNFAACVVIGAALAWHGRLSDRAILFFGAFLTLAVELTQLTGTWGLYACPYRKFDVDDLILNFAGVYAGLALSRRIGWGRAGGRGLPACPPGS